MLVAIWREEWAVQLARKKPGKKAEREPKFRSYALSDPIYRKDVLEAAWERTRRNLGAPGVDGVANEQIARPDPGAAEFLGGMKLHEMNDCYQFVTPNPVLLGELNRHLKGWTNQPDPGNPHRQFDEGRGGRS